MSTANVSVIHVEIKCAANNSFTICTPCLSQKQQTALLLVNVFLTTVSDWAIEAQTCSSLADSVVHTPPSTSLPLAWTIEGCWDMKHGWTLTYAQYLFEWTHTQSGSLVCLVCMPNISTRWQCCVSIKLPVVTLTQICQTFVCVETGQCVFCDLFVSFLYRTVVHVLCYCVLKITTRRHCK